MKIQVEENAERLAEAAANCIARYIRRHPNALMCFAAGETPLLMLDKLVEMQARGEVDLASVWYVGLDEWQGIGYETKGSCCQVMRDRFYTPAGIPHERMRIWDGKAQDPARECAEIDQFIKRSGGIGLALLGVGMNGHIGFNEPGAPLDQACMVVELDEVTARVGRKYFSGKTCPMYGMTIGMPRLLSSDQLVLMAQGAHKAPIIRKALMEEASPRIPASQLQKNPNLKVFIDQDVWRNL